MKKKNIIVAILVIIGLITFIVTAISGQEQTLSEKRLGTVITNFLARDYIWDESRKEICYPEYIEISVFEDSEFFIKVPLDTNYSMYYSTSNSEPNFFIETPFSIKDAVHCEFADLFSICKRLSSGTCFLRTLTGDTVTVEKIRIYRSGIVEALDSSENWHEKISCNNFILTWSFLLGCYTTKKFLFAI